MLHDSIWRHRDLRLLIPARAVSAFGDDVALLVLTLRVYGEGRGPWSITILLLCATVPIVVLAPLAGRLVDSVPFRTLATTAAVGMIQAQPGQRRSAMFLGTANATAALARRSFFICAPALLMATRANADTRQRKMRNTLPEPEDYAVCASRASRPRPGFGALPCAGYLSRIAIAYRSNFKT